MRGKHNPLVKDDVKDLAYYLGWKVKGKKRRPHGISTKPKDGSDNKGWFKKGHMTNKGKKIKVVGAQKVNQFKKGYKPWNKDITWKRKKNRIPFEGTAHEPLPYDYHF